ncbi:RNA polymerase sigma factor [Breznakia pachnodae]|uniref:RNA polymerase sigma factor (Sigma-70 family) n=1 Tax=Breznakia pachnodae TaxID=265178 RepID=A0ABU0DYX3_9FIRM|nr:sigma-70 family RNA polymerase sigma factor [Breznakia pachnodae]MDQ0359849.1 RNA polymerase sigma factor (sigma-70 family) [Breznakia pachnodae]
MNQKKQYLISDDIVVNAQKGDTEAFTVIYQAYFPKISFVTRQFAINEEAAKDLTQEIFITVYQKIHELQEPKAFHSWIQKISYHKCLNYNRSKYRIVNFDEENAAEEVEDTKLKDALEIVEEKRMMNTIEQSLNEMTINLKTVGLLRYIEGMSVNEIADLLSIPKGTVKSRLSTVRTNLKGDLKRKGITPSNYMVIIMFPGIVSQYFSNYIFSQSAGATGTLSSLLSYKISAVVGSLLVTSVVAGSAFTIWNNTQETQMVGHSINTEVFQSTPIEAKESFAAEIQNIYVDTNWTNQPVYVYVETTSDAYDEIRVNNTPTQYVYENGTHKVQLIKDGNVIDEKSIEVRNIDIESPYGSSDRNGNSFVIYLKDDLAGVDPSSITLIRNGVSSDEYIYDSQNNTLAVTTQRSYGDLIYISDYAGNVFEISFE